ncbi:MAG: beta-aspartyl-peptidase, partial [Synergistaceae bacterium]|nr:beta-aspartyl-peptidase [Synergistaceae bacterium]
MKLELHRLFVKGLTFGEKTGFDKSSGTLTVNKAELLELISDDDLLGKNLDVDIAIPGTKTRVMPVKDVIEPRYKIEGKGQIFPGMLSSVDTVGEGKTLVLTGAAVLTAGKLVRFQEGIIDM